MKFQSGKDSRKLLALTIYNDFAAVREVRSLQFETEINHLVIGDLPAGIEADSFFVKGAAVLEQDYERGITDKEQLLKKYIGRVVTVGNLESGTETKVRLLKAGFDFIGKIEGTDEIFVNPGGHIILPSKGVEIQIDPAISCRIETLHEDTDVGLHYLVSGLNWEANYTAELLDEEMILNGWIKITNYAGGDFENCQIRAVAGILKRSGEGVPLMENSRFNAKDPSGELKPYGFSEGNVYELDGTFSIAEGGFKQVRFLHNQHAAFQKTYRIEDRQENASIQLQLGNATDPGLNIPLPQGIIKFYGHGGNGELEFLGEDEISHMSAKEKIVVTIGKTFDLTNKSFEKSRKVTGGSEYVTFVYRIKNSKQKNVAVLVDHLVSDPIWEMESSTHDYEVKASRTLEFHVRMGAGKTVELEFTYKAKRR
ncbi:DUF4139 domain-containing protein [Planococcus halotolerans]|uniref:DUF4139 domain-containing protein n=1 Tax=Planococcus halotolerans TaxID=2233542 RepID=A0A365KRI6_9BACL|nr:hypothetical protein [Planococcus halotolerans]QHJ69471.1 hypothetical protein DNR44_001975 [Planococcus halotolerans]RAZ75422.1 hypothetical protein DP120_13685 [Planococcus halotolerans]